MPLMLCVKPIAYATCLKEEHKVVVGKEFDEVEGVVVDNNADDDATPLINKSDKDRESSTVYFD